MKRSSPSYSVGWTLFFVVFFALITVGTILGVVAFGMVKDTRNTLDEYRYCLFMDGEQVFEGGGGDPDGHGFGYLEFNANDNSLKYLILFADIGTPSSMHVHGPVDTSDPLTSTIFIPTTGSLDVTVTDGSQLSGDLKITSSQIEALLKAPSFFYLLLKTDDFPTGSIAARLGIDCRKQI